MRPTMDENPLPSDWVEVREPNPQDLLIADLVAKKKLDPESRSKASSLHSTSSSAKRAIASAAANVLLKSKTRSESSWSASASINEDPSKVKGIQLGGSSAAGSESAASKNWDLLSDTQLGRLESPRGFQADEDAPDPRSKALREAAEQYWKEHPDFRAAKVTHPKRARWGDKADPAIEHGNLFRGLILHPDGSRYTQCY